MPIVERGPRAERRRSQHAVRKPADADEGRRALAILRLMDGATVTEASGLLEAARFSVYRWVKRYHQLGLAGLHSDSRGRVHRTVTHELIERLHELLGQTPQAYGYLRSTWRSELLAKALGRPIHPLTVRRLLPRLGCRWRRARPTLCKRDPRKAENLEAIHEAIESADEYTEVFFVDEVDIDFNPRVGFSWRRRGIQEAIPTPGQNQKHYVAGALHAHSGRLVWVEHARNNTAIFIKLLDELRRRYRRARRIVLVLDNYRIHKSNRVFEWLAANPKFVPLFQPVYHPWVIEIECLWRAMLDTVTRNHRCDTMRELCQNVARLFRFVQPFPRKRPWCRTIGISYLDFRVNFPQVYSRWISTLSLPPLAPRYPA